MSKMLRKFHQVLLEQMDTFQIHDQENHLICAVLRRINCYFHDKDLSSLHLNEEEQWFAVSGKY